MLIVSCRNLVIFMLALSVSACSSADPNSDESSPESAISEQDTADFPTIDVDPDAADVTLSRTAVSKFHTDYNNRDFAAISQGTDAYSDTSRSNRAPNPMYSLLREHFGEMYETREVGWTRSENSSRHLMTFRQETTFENGQAFETFFFLIRDEEPKLAMYSIRSGEVELSFN
ncbi:hypothetical protein [Parasphingopyxis sp.]|uniref:hypothetical protein n=1 Tax=Parasphingopyxis sp. TaxID=1920299 RepID=UPI002609E586|nr:hypothetical protein [Parasphingopyxis sp.]